MNRTAFRWHARSSSFLVLIVLVVSATGQERAARDNQQARTGDDVVVERDRDTQTMQVKIPAKDGKVAWSDVLKALMRAGRLEDSALQDKLPAGSLDLERAYSQYALLAVNLALAPDIGMQIVPRSGAEAAHLLVTIDEGSLDAKKRKLAKRVRDRIAKRDGRRSETLFGFRLRETWEQTDQRKPLILVVHGFNSSPERFQPVAETLRQKGLVSGTYSYPDDQPISESAVQLSTDLKKLASDQPLRRVVLVTHSMGGLVAREVVENPDLDPGTVTKLIMVATPNHGSLLARIAYGLDILDHAMPTEDRKEVSRFYAAVEDGLSEAKEDLEPDSTFLRKLNARSRNPQVRYSLFLGTGGRLTQQQLDNLRGGLHTAENASNVVGLFAPRVDETLADLDEVVHGKGDGVVAVKRGRLEGVADTVLLEFTHLGALQEPDKFAGDPLFKMVLERIAD